MTSPPPTRHVAVIGGGITGLTTASHLADAGMRVTVLEATDRVGGQVRTVPIRDVPVDVGAESLHAGAPAVLDLLTRLGLDGDVRDARPGPTLIATRRGLRRLPAGMGPAGPTRLWPVVTSRVLSPSGLLRAAAEPLVPRRPLGDDVAVGAYLTHRFGRQLTARLLDPLLGNLHAGDVDRLSLASATPQLDRLARRHRSLVLGRRAAPAAPPPRFVTVHGGLHRVTEALAADPRVDVRRTSPAHRLARHGRGYEVAGAGWTIDDVDAVVLATPAAAAARLLGPLDPDVDRLLSGLESATVATAVLAYRSVDTTRRDVGAANGLLVTSGTGRTLKAASFLTNKWHHLDGHGRTYVRLSAGRGGDERIGRLSDDELLAELRADLGDLTGWRAEPVAAVLQRWPATMPQLQVGHRATIAAVRERLDATHHIALAGAAYDGVGIASCLASASAAARRILDGAARELVA